MKSTLKVGAKTLWALSEVSPMDWKRLNRWLLLLAPPSLLHAPSKFENISNVSFMKLQFYFYGGG